MKESKNKDNDKPKKVIMVGSIHSSMLVDYSKLMAESTDDLIALLAMYKIKLEGESLRGKNVYKEIRKDLKKLN